jgi:hypothetical protein
MNDQNKAKTGHNAIRIEIVRTHEQLMHAYAIRSICFMEEAGLQVEQAFDGNDFQATHVIIYNGNEPIGALRIRWFNNFARLERTAFRQAYRNASVLRKTANFVFAHVARKGYSQVFTHAKPVYAQLWCRLLGFEKTQSPPMLFSGHNEPYIELVRYIAMPSNVINYDTDCRIQFRVEGDWDRPDRFEETA